MPELIATKALTHAGRALRPGDRFHATEQWARIWRGIRKARPADDLPPQAQAVAVATPAPMPVKETPPPPPEVEVEEDDIDALRAAYETATGERPDMRWRGTRLRSEIANAGRTYQRRDMQAED